MPFSICYYTVILKSLPFEAVPKSTFLSAIERCRFYPSSEPRHLFASYLNDANAAFATSPSCTEDIPDIPIAPIIFPLE